jgi:hypothetical protein
MVGFSIIGISGRAGAGKDACADFIHKDFNFVRIALADEVKRIAGKLFNFSDDQLWGPSELRSLPNTKYPLPPKYQDGTSVIKYLTPRRACQKLGTEFGRECYENIWIDKVLETANRLREARKNLETLDYLFHCGLFDCGGTVPDYNGVVISDCRFLNELEEIKNAGGFLVRIVRPGSFIDEEYNKHQSESEMREISDSLFDLIITNDGSLDELREKTKRGVNYLLHNGA